MSVSITRKDYTSLELRALSRTARTVVAARRMLAIANVLEGVSRKDAARGAGMDRQTLRDWVHRYNDEGPEGLYDRPRGHPKPRLNDKQKNKIREIVRKGPDPERDGVVRWRCKDIRALIEERYGVSYSEYHVERLLKQMGLVKLTARPRNPKTSKEDQETFKKTLVTR